MSTDTLDARIRRAVVQIVDTSPPAPTLDESMPTTTVRRRGPRLVPALVGAALAIAIVALVAVLATRGEDRVPPARSTSPVAQLNIEALSTLSYNRDSWTVPAGRVRIHFSGATGHTFTIDSPTTHDLLLSTDRGGSRNATVTLRPGTYTMGSTIPGHRAAGMIATLHVLRSPVQWVTPQGAADPTIVLPDMRTDATGPPGPIGTAVERLAQAHLHGDPTTPPDVSSDRLLGPIGQTSIVYGSDERQFDIVAFRLPHPVSAATIGAGHATHFERSAAGNQLVFVGDLYTVYLVRPGGAVARITRSGRDPGFLLTDDDLVGMAEALDRPAFDRAVG